MNADTSPTTTINVKTKKTYQSLISARIKVAKQFFTEWHDFDLQNVSLAAATVHKIILNPFSKDLIDMTN